MAENGRGSTGAGGSRNVAAVTTTGSAGVVTTRSKRSRDVEGTDASSAPVPTTAGGSNSGNAEALRDATEPVWMVPKYFKREGGGDRPLDKQPNHMVPAVRDTLFALVRRYGWEGAKAFTAFLGICMARKLIVLCDSSLEPCSVAKFSSELALVDHPLQSDAFLGNAKTLMTLLKEFVAAQPHGNEVDGDGRLVMKDGVWSGGFMGKVIQFINVCVSSRHTDVVHQILRHVKLTNDQADYCFSFATVRPKDFKATTKHPDPPVTTMQEVLMGLVPDPVRQLEIAIEKHHVEFVRKFGNKDTINIPVRHNIPVRPLLHTAVFSKNPSMVNVLLEKGADVHASDKYGKTALHLAVIFQRERIVKVLLEKGADVHARDNDGRTALHDAVNYLNEAIVKVLLEKGADVHASENYGRTALHFAVFYQKERMVKVLLEKGVDVNVRDVSGKTALMLAKKQEIITLLTGTNKS